jgi:hypothetical protein
MPKGARIVDQAQIVRDTKRFVIARDGAARTIMRGIIAHDGVVCEFWPPEEVVQNPIIMTTDAALSYDIKQPSQGQPQAKCDYDARTGNLIVSSPTGDVVIPVLAPVPRGTGQYLCKFEPVTGVFVKHFPDSGSYDPGMMQYNGTTGYYSKTGLTTSGNKVTVVLRFSAASSAADQRLFSVVRTANLRVGVTVKENDHANVDMRNKLQFICFTSTGTIICRVQSLASVADSVVHTVFLEYDGDAGTAVMRIDGVDALDPGNSLHTLTTGTITTGASTDFYVGAGAGPALYHAGQLGFVGYRDIGGLDWADFMEPDGAPKPLDETTWSEWGAQPPFWNAQGDMEDNLGSAGNMTKSGTITAIPGAPVAAPAWHDVLEEGTLGLFHNYLPNTTALPGQVTGQAIFSLAADDGTGAPDALTQIDKTIDFIAERTGTNLILTQDPWSLEDIKVNEMAYVRVRIGTDGVLRGYEGLTEVLTENYAVNWNTGFKVQVTVVSGSVIGVTGTLLDLTSNRNWALQMMAGGGAAVAVIDLTVTEGSNSVTKRISLSVNSSDESASSSLSDDFTQYNYLHDDKETYNGNEADAGFYLWVNPDGRLNCENVSLPGQSEPTFPQDWNVLAPTPPDPENFECMVTPLTGDLPSGTLDTWLNCSSQRTWSFISFADSTPLTGRVVERKAGAILLSIREVGRPDTVKLKTINLLALAISNVGIHP